MIVPWPLAWSCSSNKGPMQDILLAIARDIQIIQAIATGTIRICSKGTTFNGAIQKLKLIYIRIIDLIILYMLYS